MESSKGNDAALIIKCDEQDSGTPSLNVNDNSV